MLHTLKAKYESNFKCLEEKLVPKTNENELKNKSLINEVDDFLGSIITPRLEAQITSYLEAPLHKHFISKFSIEFWHAGSGIIFEVSNCYDFNICTFYSKRAHTRIFTFMSSDDSEEIYTYIRHFAKEKYDIDVDDSNFGDDKFLIASVNYKN